MKRGKVITSFATGCMTFGYGYWNGKWPSWRHIQVNLPSYPPSSVTGWKHVMGSQQCHKATQGM